MGADIVACCIKVRRRGVELIRGMYIANFPKLNQYIGIMRNMRENEKRENAEK